MKMVNFAIVFGQFLMDLPVEHRAGILGGLTEGALADAPEEMRKFYLEELANKFNMGFHRVETGATSTSGPETDRICGYAFLGGVLPGGNA